MERLLREGVVIDHRLSFRETIHHGRLIDVNLTGWVATASGGRVYVNKLLLVLERARRAPAVQTREYAYQGRFVLSPRAGQQLFRYDNCHGGLETLHRHQFDVQGDEMDTRPLTLEEMPSLADVIREAEHYSAYLRDLRQA